MAIDYHLKAVQGIQASIDNLSAVIVAALDEHAKTTQQMGVDIVAAIDRLIEAETPPPLGVDALRGGDRP